jgi:polysaccharide biosynthesis protein PslH
MIKILSIAWFKVLPPRFGGQKGIALFNQYLSQYDPLVCLCSKNNQPPADLNYKTRLELPVSKMQFLDPFCWKKIRKIIKDEKATHLILEHPYHGMAGYLAKKRNGVKLIVHSHNIEWQRFKKMGKYWWPLMKWYEGWTYRKADLNLFKTQTDLQCAVDHFKMPAAKCLVVPFGIGVREKPVNIQEAKQLIRQRHTILPGEKILLFSGTLDYRPNARAVESIYKEIIPRLAKTRGLNFRVIITGRNHSSAFSHLNNLHDPNATMTGEVDDIETYFAAADVFVNPVTEGGGIQTKNIEALSHHCNVVAFDNMLDGIQADLCLGKLFAAKNNDWNDFTTKILMAAGHSTQTPDAFFEYYSWQRITKTVADRIAEL